MPNTAARLAATTAADNGAVSRAFVTDVVRDCAAPAWAHELADRGYELLTACVPSVPELSPQEFEEQTFGAYRAIARRLSAAGGRTLQPVRFWNHVPFITDPADAGRDNYMVFNAGRFRAFSDWYGGAAAFDSRVATASAIGHWGRDLVIHCLAGDAAGEAVNNPRQVAPYHYSQRFGPLPPCFARATRLSGPAELLLVGGTASVRGEDSVHLDDLASQCRETFVNLATLIGAATRRKLTPSVKLPQWLRAFRELRVYYPDRNHEGEIVAAVARTFPALDRLELLHADLCRGELLVEIEGLADLTRLKHAGD